MDYFRTDCIKSYFELVALVNKGNRVINEQTKASFFISGELFIGIDEKQKILLCKYQNQWFPSEISNHDQLEKFICNVLNSRRIQSGEVDELIKAELFKLPS